MKPISTKWIHFRIIFIAAIFTLIFLGITARAIYVQVYQSPWLSQKAIGQIIKSLVVDGRRGAILDARHREMAVSLKVQSIAAFPNRIPNMETVARDLSRQLKLDYNELKKRLSTDKSFVWVKRKANPQECEDIAALNLPGIGFISEYNRFYPNKNLAAQVLGFAGVDGRGLEGIEFFYDDVLRGKALKLTHIKDALGRNIDLNFESNDTESSGHNIILTIDRAIQYIAEEALAEAVSQYTPKTAIALVMDAQKGAILALAHYPEFNPNVFGEFGRDVWRNRAVTDSFEPGSTMKIFTAAAAIESELCTMNSIFFCENGNYKIGPNTIHDTHSYGWLSLQQIVKYSSNIGAVKIMEKMGKKNLYTTLQKFGFGEKTGIDCPGETTGNLPPFQKWMPIDAGTISFGQGIAVSAIQLATAVTAIANDGILKKPYLVQAVISENGKLIRGGHVQEETRVISSSTASIIKSILQTVTTEGGTGTNAAIDGFSVGGKTGTAQKIDGIKGYAKGKYVSSFIGFAPVERPRITVLVILDEPAQKHYGGTVAAPAFRKITHSALLYLNVEPDNQSNLANRLSVSWSNGVNR